KTSYVLALFLFLRFKVGTNKCFCGNWHCTFIKVEHRMMVWIGMSFFLCTCKEKYTFFLSHIVGKMFSTHLGFCNIFFFIFWDVFTRFKYCCYILFVITDRWIAFTVFYIILGIICMIKTV